MSIALKKLTNAHDGTHLLAEIDGTPSGQLTFWCARTPETPFASRRPLPHFVVPGQPKVWRLTMPAPAGWYVWARDGAGDCREPRAQFCGVTDHALTEEVGEWLRDTLTRHKPLFDACLESRYPAPIPGIAPKIPVPRIMQTLFGTAALAKSWPAIIIDEPELDEPYIGTDTLRQVYVKMRISCCWVHADHLDQLLPAMSTLARRVQETLNLFEYNSILLPSGIRLSNCQAPSMTTTEIPIEAGWGAEASLTWSGETTRRQSV